MGVNWENKTRSLIWLFTIVFSNKTLDKINFGTFQFYLILAEFRDIYAFPHFSGTEAFIDKFGSVMITQPLKIPAKMRVNVNATLCGVPRIRPLAQMKVMANKDLESRQCRMIVEDHRLICGNQLLLSIINIQENEEVELNAMSLIAFAKVCLLLFLFHEKFVSKLHCCKELTIFLVDISVTLVF